VRSGNVTEAVPRIGSPNGALAESISEAYYALCIARTLPSVVALPGSI
jgi:hypothetical protein